MEVNSLRGDDPARLFTKDCVKIAVNLNSRDTTPMSEIRGWTQLSGWSERIFSFVRFTRESDSVVQKLFDASK